MMQLLRTELLKLAHYRTFWVILGLYVGLLVLFMYGSSQVSINGQQAGTALYQLPALWMRLTYIASYFNLLLGILLIILITDEYTFRTFRQHVIDGWFRSDILNAKYGLLVLISAICTLVLLVIGLGFGIPNTREFNLMVPETMHLVYYFIQALGYMSIAVLVAFIIRKNGLAIICFLLYTKIIEPLIHWQVTDTLDKYFPMKVFSSLTPTPGQELLDSLTGPSIALTPQQAVIPALVYIVIFYLLSYVLLQNRDL